MRRIIKVSHCISKVLSLTACFWQNRKLSLTWQQLEFYSERAVLCYVDNVNFPNSNWIFSVLKVSEFLPNKQIILCSSGDNILNITSGHRSVPHASGCQHSHLSKIYHKTIHFIHFRFLSPLKIYRVGQARGLHWTRL